MVPSSNKYIRAVRKVVGKFLDFMTYFHLCFSKKLNSSRILNFTHGRGVEGKRILIYACYCSVEKELDSRIQDVLLLSNDFDQIYIINSGDVRSGHWQTKGLVIVNRPNSSRDLGAYKDVISNLQTLNLSELVLVNDSVFWLGDSLLNFVQRARASEFRITGLTLSNQGGPHIQSYAIHFKNPSPEILAPVLRIRNWGIKRTLVVQGERYFSKVWTKQKIAFGALYPNKLLISKSLVNIRLIGRDQTAFCKLIEQGVELNPSIHYWPGLLVEAKVVKKSLIYANPAKFLDVPKSIQEVETILRESLRN
jgi:hypothetical protein